MKSSVFWLLTCKELQELRIIDSPVRRNLHITEQGLVALSAVAQSLKIELYM